MPLHDITCRACGFMGESLSLSSSAQPVCPSCGSQDTEKHIAASSTLTGKTRQRVPGPGDTGCCGSSPGAAGCAGPGSCCGKNLG